MPRISFIMPAYKSAFIKQAIDSVVSQISSDWELVVVDDASPEGLEDIVAPYCEKFANVRYYRNENNIGGTNLVNQWNHCLQYAEGDWVVMAGDDDVYDPHFCEECQNLIEKYPDVNLVRSRVLQIDDKGKALYNDGEPSEYVNKYGYLYDWLTAKIFTCVGNYVFRKSSLTEMGGFMDFPCAFCSDIATPIALSVNGVANTKDMLFSFRHSSIHLSGDNSKLREKIMATTQLYLWLDKQVANSYKTIETEEQKGVIDSAYIHAKCIYDYYNHGVRYAPYSEYLRYLQLCTNANWYEKCIMVLRSIKRSIASVIRGFRASCQIM